MWKNHWGEAFWKKWLNKSRIIINNIFSLHKKWSFPLRISLHLLKRSSMENICLFFFVQVFLYFLEFTNRSARNPQETSGILFVIANISGREYNFGNWSFNSILSFTNSLPTPHPLASPVARRKKYMQKLAFHTLTLVL